MFRNRGSSPNIEFNVKLGESNNTDNIGIGRSSNSDNSPDSSPDFHVPHFTNYWNGYYYVVHYDAKLVITQAIVYAIFLLIAVLVYIYKYNALLDDPIIQVKNAILRIQFIQMGVTIGIAALAMFLSKNKERLIKTLNILAIISIFMSITIIGIKLYMDNQYNEEKFKQFYDEYESIKGNYTETAKVILGNSWTLKVIDSKEAYVRNSKTAYMQFTVKQIIYVIINVFISIGVLYLADRISKIEEKKERLAKDDIVLNDEEENVKY